MIQYKNILLVVNITTEFIIFGVFEIDFVNTTKSLCILGLPMLELLNGLL